MKVNYNESEVKTKTIVTNFVCNRLGTELNIHSNKWKTRSVIGFQLDFQMLFIIVRIETRIKWTKNV